jgi:sulfur-oxidizing protein SoxX
MRKALSAALAAVAAIATCGCSGGRKGSSGFHLPDGDVEHGKAVFLAMNCQACHRVAGVDLPPPVADPPVPVVLGGKVVEPRTDGQLVTAIVEPNHTLAPGYPLKSIKAGGLSRMGEFGDALSVHELIDLVAFLQSRYVVVPPPPPMK